MTINLNLPSMTSWKTTLVGLISLAYGVYQASGQKSIQDAIRDPAVVSAFIVALMGWFAKDHAVTGGTIGQPSTHEALAVANVAPATGVNAPKIDVPPVPKP